MLTPRRKKKTKTKLNKQWPWAAEGSQTNNSGPTKKAKNGSITCGEKNITGDTWQRYEISAIRIQIMDRQTLLGNIYGETSAPTQTAFAEQDETINYFREHCNARGTHLIIHYPRNVGIMLIKMKGESHFHFLLRCTELWRSSLARRLSQVIEGCLQEPGPVI